MAHPLLGACALALALTPGATTPGSISPSAQEAPVPARRATFLVVDNRDEPLPNVALHLQHAETHKRIANLRTNRNGEAYVESAFTPGDYALEVVRQGASLKTVMTVDERASAEGIFVIHLSTDPFGRKRGTGAGAVVDTPFNPAVGVAVTLRPGAKPNPCKPRVNP